MANAPTCPVCELEPVEPFVIAGGFGSACGACVETLRGAVLATLALDPTSRPILEQKLLSENPHTRLAASRAIVVQDAVKRRADELRSRNDFHLRSRLGLA